ncbi:factor of DNA methylation 4-like [Solanum lycopersicum]|uniref:factor of DNA methylation 4-like n=1 Tax=Solanum lycopersicum TaxID=4081 RepID=UPI003747DDC2
MSHRRSGKSGRTDSEFEELKYKYFKDLRDEKVKISRSGKYFKCPYCQDSSREYDSQELLRHSSRIGIDSRSASFRDKARHLGLFKYLDRYIHVDKNTSESSRRRYSELSGEGSQYTKSNPVEPSQVTEKSEGGGNFYPPAARSIEAVDRPVDGAEEPLRRKKQNAENRVVLEPPPKSTKDGMQPQPLLASSKPGISKTKDDLIVFPWMGIVANIPIEYKEGKRVGKSGTNLKKLWIEKGFNPLKVHPLWNYKGHTGYAIVEFKGDWSGFMNAIAFEKAFELDKHGKRDWNSVRHPDSNLYAWIARDEDYNAGSFIGTYLRKHGDLKSVSGIQEENKRKDSRLLWTLTNELEMKNKECEEMEKKITRAEVFMDNVMSQKEEMVKNYNEEMEMMRHKAFHQLDDVIREHEKSKMQLEAQKQQLMQQELELRKREALNESEKRKLQLQKEMNERAILEQRNADEKMLQLAEDHKRVKEQLHKRIIELEANLDQKQALQLQIERLRGSMEVMRLMNEEGDVEAKKKLQSIQEEIKESEEELDSLETLNQALIIKERLTNDEVQEARKELIHGLRESRAFIGVKRMGELDGKPFHAAAKRKFNPKEAAEKAVEICSLWEDYLRDPNWHPYKIIQKGHTAEEIIDDDDEKLKELKAEYGDEVYQSVVTALNELNEHNPSGRYPVPALWHYKEKRTVSLNEGVKHIMKQWKAHKKKLR